MSVKLRYELTATAVACLLLFAGGFVNSAADKLVEGGLRQGPWFGLWVILWGIVFLGLTYYVIRNRNKLLASQARMVLLNRQRPIKYLVMGYSPMPKTSWAPAMKELDELKLDKLVLLTQDYKALYPPENPAPMFKWQQNLRAIHPHRKTIERVFVVPPSDNIDEQEAFATYLTEAFGKKRDFVEFLPVRRVVQGDDATARQDPYEDYDYVFKTVRDAMRTIMKRYRVSHEDICVDSTSGLKTFSIGAAIATLNAECLFSYVNNDGHIKFYDAEVVVGSQE